jgi:hypothetical protein
MLVQYALVSGSPKAIGAGDSAPMVFSRAGFVAHRVARVAAVSSRLIDAVIAMTT